MFKASIIISVDNKYPLINNFFNMLLTHINKKEYEIIVVDDCCSDYQTKEYLNKLKKEDSIDVYIILDKKYGFGRANNLGVEKSTTDCLIFINTDIIITNDVIEQLFTIYNSKKYAAIQPLLLYPQSEKIQSAGHIFASYFNRHALENNSISVIKNDQNPIIRQALTLAFCMIDRDAFEKAGKFNDFYYNGYEGIELILKISQTHTCVVIPYIHAYHIRSVAVKNSNFDEEQKIPYFWCQCQKYIHNDFYKFIQEQIPQNAFDKNYFAIQFTTLDLLSEVRKAGIKIRDDILLIQKVGNPIELFSILPYSYLNTASCLLFLCDNFVQLNPNHLWIQMRKGKNDLIIDSNGNVIKLQCLKS